MVGFFLFHRCNVSYIYITVSNDRNSTRETLTRDPSTREPSVIEIDASNEEENKSTDDETPEEELSTYLFL